MKFCVRSSDLVPKWYLRKPFYCTYRLSAFNAFPNTFFTSLVEEPTLPKKISEWKTIKKLTKQNMFETKTECYNHKISTSTSVLPLNAYFKFRPNSCCTLLTLFIYSSFYLIGE
uniref:Uncharacterized protein n=1 Tax=Cacopsylla melanoneura TaxID=428564 RepID=A0A8D8TJX2_9HEMI